MTLEEATALAQKQANEFGVLMIVVKDDAEFQEPKWHSNL